jgi:hypothetical protein
MEFESAIPVFEWAKTFHALDCAATLIGLLPINLSQLFVHSYLYTLFLSYTHALLSHEQIFFLSCSHFLLLIHSHPLPLIHRNLFTPFHSLTILYSLPLTYPLTYSHPFLRTHTNLWTLTHTVKNLKKTPWPLVRKRTIPTERPPLVGEVSANFCG